MSIFAGDIHVIAYEIEIVPYSLFCSYSLTMGCCVNVHESFQIVNRSLYNNDITELPSGVFSELSSLREL